jgi:hypothetical protein
VIELHEELTSSVPDPLCRWIRLPNQRMYRVVNGVGSHVIIIRTNSTLLFQSLDLFQNGDLHASSKEADFRWDIVVEEEDPGSDADATSNEVSVLTADTMHTAYFGQKSFFAISPQNCYAAGFLSLPAGVAAKQDLLEEYLTLLRQLSMDLLSGADLEHTKTGLA